MQNSKLISILKTFSKEEINSFEKFVRSPYFNTSEGTIALLNEIKKTFPRFSHKMIMKERLFEKIYKKKDYNALLMRKLISNLLKLSEEFISVNSFRKSKIVFNIKLLNELYERKLHNVFRIKIKEAESLLGNYPYRSENYYLNRYQFYYILCEFESNRNVLSSKAIFQQQIYEINSVYLASVLRLYSVLAMYKHSLDFEFDFTMIDEIESYFRKNDKNVEQDITFFFHTMQMFRTDTPENEVHYKRARELFGKVKGIFNFDDSKYALYLLTNFCYMMLQSGNTKYAEDHFELQMMDVEISKVETFYLDPNQYLNVVLSAAGAKKYDWAKQYIDEMKNRISLDRREDIYKYANATLLYEQKKYRDALQYLSTISPTFWQSQSYIKDLTIKIYFEMGMYEEVEYQIDSFRHYVKKARNVPKYMRKRDEIFIQFLQRLIRQKHNPDDAEINILRKQIKTSNTNNKQWLLSKLQ